MNVIVSNLNKNKFSNLDVDVIKSITGEFTADEIVQTFSNFFHSDRSASAWLREKSSSALKRQLDYITILWSHCQYPFLIFSIRAQYSVSDTPGI